MFEGWAIVTLGVSYIGTLFLIAAIGDRFFRAKKGGEGRPFIYSLSLAVYCTSWTFFGSVGLAASTGYDFIPVYIGPLLFFVFGTPLLLRVISLAKSQNLTSVADFIAARYGKSQTVAAVVTVIAVIGSLPYIALQLKAVVLSVGTLLARGNAPIAVFAENVAVETALAVALALAAFAMLFGTRHTDATEHQDGLMFAIAAESLVKLAAFFAVGLFVVYGLYGDPVAFVAAAGKNEIVESTFSRPFNGGTFLTVTLLSFFAILLLPRQFHVAVVENNAESEVRRAQWMFPLYLVLINVFVVPIAAAGLMRFESGAVDADLFVLALPLAENAKVLAVIVFLGGLSAATAMVIVESVALAIMVCNGLVIPLLIRYRVLEAGRAETLAPLLLLIRRIAIAAIILLGYGVYRLLGATQGLASLGLLSFAAIAQLAPAFLLGLLWRRGTARGAIAGMLAGFAIWAYTLILPWIAKVGLLPMDLVSAGPFGLAILKPQGLFFLEFEPLTHGVLWSLIANVTTYIAVSLLRPPLPIERLQAQAFVYDEPPRLGGAGQPFRLWRTTVTVGELQATAARYLGAERAERSFQEFAESRGTTLWSQSEADAQVLRFTEHLLASAIGAASARLVLSLLLRRGNVGSQAALRLLDDASEALQYNRDLLQSALDQVRHGLGVFDKDLRLICWNRQFRELLHLPPELGRVGIPLERLIQELAKRGDLGPGDPDRLTADRVDRLAIRRQTLQQRVFGNRIVEFGTAAMPQGGIVMTCLDITDRVTAANELARANETLERRVRERTAELLEVNAALAIAKSNADEANLDKTRFLAAASHDILQPLNAARLYATSLSERPLAAGDAALARNLDSALQAVEEILATLIDISRMDAGRIEPEMTDVSLDELFEQLKIEFEPVARAKGLDLRVLSTSIWVRSDRRLLRRVLQNLLSNAVKYTPRGRVLLGAQRRGDRVIVRVLDTGPGIPLAKQEVVFKEFERLSETATSVRGLGLGLSIVDRISRVLDVPIGLSSTVGQGSSFSVTLPWTRARADARREEPLAIGPLAGTVAIIIDNEPAVLNGMETLLAGWGCHVASGADAAGALAAVERLARTPDVILADYHLDAGTGLDAIETIRRELGRDLPAIVITADHTPEVQREIRLRGFGLLRKPLKAGALRALLTQHALRRAASAAE